jgi:hypothetical protein
MALPPAALQFHRGQVALLRKHRMPVLILLLATSIAGIALPILRTTNSEAARLAFIQAQASPDAIRTLGEPLSHGHLAFGDVETHGARGQASVSFAVYGPRGIGRLYADAVRVDRSWQLISLDLELPSHAGRLNLMPIQSTVPR